MDKLQAGQEETLVGVRMEVTRRPAASRGCFKCVVALAMVMGLLAAALMAGFVLYVRLSPTTCSQEVQPPTDTHRVNITCKLQKSDDPTRHDIFTSDKGATYLLYGWVKFSVASGEVVVLRQDRDLDNNRGSIIARWTINQNLTFFSSKVHLADHVRISLQFQSGYTDSSFQVYELPAEEAG